MVDNVVFSFECKFVSGPDSRKVLSPPTVSPAPPQPLLSFVFLKIDERQLVFNLKTQLQGALKSELEREMLKDLEPSVKI